MMSDTDKDPHLNKGRQKENENSDCDLVTGPTQTTGPDKMTEKAAKQNVQAETDKEDDDRINKEVKG